MITESGNILMLAYIKEFTHVDRREDSQTEPDRCEYLAYCLLR